MRVRRMTMSKNTMGISGWTLGFLIGVEIALPVLAQSIPADGPAIREAEITANDVYVRSGDSLNHYTICKLRAGDRVTVVGERGDWYEILPPDGNFSLISGDYVDTTDNQKGVVNGNNVRVRAGSLLNENKYTVQTLLSKGAEVTILGRNPDGFLRIRPPAGATVWVSRSYAQLRSDSRSTSETTQGIAPTLHSETGSPVSTSDSSDGDASGVQRTIGAPPPAGTMSSERARSGHSNEWQKKLDDLDAAVNAEFDKPVGDRQFESSLGEYRKVSLEASNEIVRQIAQRRIEEIERAMEAAKAYDHLKRLDELAESKRREFRTSRAAIPEAVPPLPIGIEAKGELRVSALFPPDSPNPRYRLVDPTVAGGKTIGYIEIPRESSINPRDFLGRYVGVRALDRRIQTGGVDPVPIFIAGDLILMQPPDAPLSKPEDAPAETEKTP